MAGSPKTRNCERLREGLFCQSEAPLKMHGGKTCHEWHFFVRARTTAISCHCRTPGSAFREFFCHRRAFGSATGRSATSSVWKRALRKIARPIRFSHPDGLGARETGFAGHAPRRNLVTVRRRERTSREHFVAPSARGSLVGVWRRNRKSGFYAPGLGGRDREGSSHAGIAKRDRSPGFAKFRRGRPPGSLAGSTRKVSRAQKGAAPKSGAFPANYGRKPDPP